MFKKSKRSVQTTLLTAFIMLILLVFLAYITYFVISESKKIKNRCVDSVNQNTETSAAFVDEEIKNVITVMQNVSYSNLIKEHFLTYLNKPESESDGNYSSMQNIKVLTDLLTAMIGPNRPVDQIYLYSLDSGYVGVGLDTANSSDSVQGMSWYSDLISSDKNTLVFCAQDPRLEKYYTYEEGSRFITACSVYQSTFYKPQGIIEVKRSVSTLRNKLSKIDTKTYNETIYIFDTVGNLIYCSDSENHKGDLYFRAIQKLSPVADDTNKELKYEKSTNLFYKVSSYSGFTTVIAIDNKDIYRPIYDFIKINLLIFLIFTLVISVLSYIVSGIITTPLKKMYSSITSLHTEDEGLLDAKLEQIDTNIIELDTLYSAVIDMHERAQTSMKRELVMNNQRLQSQILALQSQMNPHFLYNSLATIQAMADEGMDREVVQMCQTISRILRYISSDKEPLVKISEDVAHARDYLECMKMRYGDDLVYTIDIPEEMQELMIPKLCIQLIVENSIKFTTKNVRPPWIINVKGKLTGIYWELSVQDNGAGFAEENLAELNEKIRYINENDLLPNLEINGMGLMNIYIRFKTMYHGKHIFRISNIAPSGALVTIGGELDSNTATHMEVDTNGR